MKKLFQSRALLLTACVLLFWKGISLVLWIFLTRCDVDGSNELFFYSTGFLSSLVMFLWAVFVSEDIFTYVLLALLCLTFLAYWICFVLLALNRRSAGVASVVLLVLCALDLPMTVAYSFMEWWSISVCIALHTGIFITMALLRRTRPGVPTQLSEMPTSV